MTSLRNQLLAGAVEDKMIGAWEQLRLWSAQEEIGMLPAQVVFSFIYKRPYPIERFITCTFIIDGPLKEGSKFEQLSLPLDL